MCEPKNGCSEDHMSFKCTLVHALSRTMMLVPGVTGKIERLLDGTAGQQCVRV